MNKTAVYLGILAIAALFVSYPSLVKGSLWWDEAVYLALADNIYEHGSYGIQSIIKDDFRAPAFPVLISLVFFLFGKSQFVIQLINPFLTIILSVVLFFVGKKMYGEEAGLLAAFFVLLNGQYIFWSSKILSEPLAILIATVSLFAAYKVVEKDDRRYYCLLLPSLAIAFLTRYPLGALWPAVALYATIIKKQKLLADLKSKHFWIAAFLFLLILAPWMLLSQEKFDHPFGAALQNYEIVQGDTIPASIFIAQFFPNLHFVGLFAIGGTYLGWRRKDSKALLLALFILISFSIFSFALAHKEFRYSVITLSAFGLLAGSLVAHIDKTYDFKGAVVVLTAVLAAMMSIPSSYEAAIADKALGVSTRDAAEYLADKVPANTSIMTQNYPLFAYVTQRDIVYFPKDVWGVNEFIERYNISYVVFDTLHYYPEWTEAHFETRGDFVKEHVFKDAISNATVYRYTGN